MLESRGQGVKRNEERISDERPTKTPRIDGAEEVHAQDKIPGISRISMDFEGENGHTLKQSFIESIWSCPTDMDLICTDGVAFAHRFILMGVSDFFFQLLRHRDMKDTKAITLVDVSIVHLSLALELIYSGDTIVKESDEVLVREVLDLLGIQLELERKKVTEADLKAMCDDALEQTEVTIKIENDDDDNKMQIFEENENGGISGDEAETAKVYMIKASTVTVRGVDLIGELDEVIDDYLGEDEAETGVSEVQVNPQHRVYREPQQEMDTDESDSEVEEEESEDGDGSDKQVHFSDDNENDKGASDSEDKSGQDGENEHELIDLTSDYEDENDKGASDSEDKSGQDGENEHELIDLTSDYEDENVNDRNGTAVASSSLDKSEIRHRNPVIVAETGSGQLDLREPYANEGFITLNGKKIRWHLMEALPSLTSPELHTERMRVFTLNVIRRPQHSICTELRNLFKSLPENSLEKRLGMMAVQSEDYKEINLASILEPPKLGLACHDRCLDIGDVELVANSSECANLVRKINCYATTSTSGFELLTLLDKMLMLGNERARYNLDNYRRIINWNIPPIKRDKLLEIGNIEGLEDRAKALMKMNVAGRTVEIHRFMGPHFGWHEDYMNRNYSVGLHPGPEIGGMGLDVCSLHGLKSDVFILNVTGTQILFPMLVKDVHLVKKLEIEKLPSLSYYHGVAVSPKCLLDNLISCFPVVQKPGMLIYKYNQDLSHTCDITKLRLDMGAEIRL